MGDLRTTIWNLYFSDSLSYLGFIANLGLSVVSVAAAWAIQGFFNVKSNPIFIDPRVFLSLYLLLVFLHYKWILGRNKKFNVGFFTSAAIVIIATVSKYLYELSY